MRRKLIALLQKADLREEEITLYLLLLKLRRASMSELLDRTKLNVMTGYRTMKRLQERGLVEPIPLNNKESMYAPLALSTLIKKVDKEQRQMRRLQLALEDMDALLPYTNIDEDEPESHIEPIEIREGLDAFREEYLKMPDICEEEYLHVGNMESYWNVAGMTYDTPDELAFRAKRFRKGIYCRMVNIRSEQSEEFLRRDSLELRTSKLSDKVPVKNNYIAMAENQVTQFICDKDNPRVIVIRQPELVSLHHQQFEAMWR